MGVRGVFFFVSGACALVYQVVWMRQLVLLAGSTSAAVTTVLAVFMGGLGAGAWLFGARADRSRSPLRLYAYLEIGIGLLAMLLPHLLAAATPAYLAVARQGTLPLPLLRVLLAILLLLPPTVLMGGTFPVLLRHVGRRRCRQSARRLRADRPPRRPGSHGSGGGDQPRGGGGGAALGGA